MQRDVSRKPGALVSTGKIQTHQAPAAAVPIEALVRMGGRWLFVTILPNQELPLEGAAHLMFSLAVDKAELGALGLWAASDRCVQLSSRCLQSACSPF